MPQKCTPEKKDRREGEAVMDLFDEKQSRLNKFKTFARAITNVSREELREQEILYEKSKAEKKD